MNLPNLISLTRLFLVPVVIWLLLVHHYAWAFFVFFIAGVSDILDGLLARLLKSQTTVGLYLDPIADKVLLVGVFVTLGFKGLIPSWLVLLVVFRDLIILGGALLALLSNASLEIKPLFISKINTVAQLILVTVILAEISLKVSYPSINSVFFVIIATTTLLSGGAYVVKWLKNMGSEPTKGL